MKLSPNSAAVPAEPPPPDNGQEERLVKALAEYHEAADSGQPSDREAFLARYDDIRDELAGYLDSFDFVRAVAPELGKTSQSPNIAADALPERATLGDFRILREIGRGGMGVVYEAEQVTVGRRVALKVLPFAAMLKSQQLDRFRNEVRAAGSLNHPHIVAVHSVGQERGVHYYAMQLVEGRSLAETIAELRREHLHAHPVEQSLAPVAESTPTQPLAELSTVRTTRPNEYWRTVAQLGQQAAEALDHAHRRGVIHRDVKPANLLVGGDQHLWVADFGLARLETDVSMTSSGDLLGTLRYMSPEQAAGDRAIVDHRTDVYSLGATLYEFAALRPVFESADRTRLLRDVTSSEATPLRKVDARIPGDLETIIATAMEKDPTDRYATAGDMAADLQAFLDRRPISARPPSLAARAQRWSRRHAALVTAALVVLLLGIAGLSIGAALLAAANRQVVTERNAAEANLQLAAEAVDSLLAEMGQVAKSHGELIQAERFLTQADHFYQRLIDKATAPEVLRRAAQGYNRIGELQHSLGHHEQAFEQHETALRLLERLGDDQWRQSEVELIRANAYSGMAAVHASLLDEFGMEEHANRSREVWLRLLEREPRNVLYIDGLTRALNYLGVAYMNTARPAAAEQTFEKIMELTDGLPPGNLPTPSQLNTLAGARCNLGTLAVERGQLDEAEPLLRAAVAAQEQVAALQPQFEQYRRDLYLFQWNLVDLSVRQGKLPAAAAAAEKLAEQFHERLQPQYDAADLLLRCVEQAKGPTHAAAKTIPPGAADQWRETARRVVARAKPTAQTSVDSLGYFAWFLSMCRDQSFRDPARALALVDQALAQAPNRRFLVRVRGIALFRLGQYQEAAAALEGAIAAGGVEGIDALFAAMARARLGNRQQALVLYEKALAWQRSPDRLPTSVYDFLAVAREQAFADARSVLQLEGAASPPEAEALP